MKMSNSRVIRSGSQENPSNHSFNEIELPRLPTRECEDSVISKLVSNAVIHALEALLTALLSPIMMWRWLSKHDHFMTILRVIFEVVLELVMLIVFAGVSILTAAALIFDDVYNDTTHSTKFVLKLHMTEKNERNAQNKLVNHERNFSTLSK